MRPVSFLPKAEQQLEWFRAVVRKRLRPWRHHSEWEDLCQDALVELWQAQARYGEGGITGGLIYTIIDRSLVRSLARYHRSRGLDPRADSRAPLSWDALPPECAERGEPDESLERTVDRIAGRQLWQQLKARISDEAATLFRQHYGTGVPLRAISRRTGQALDRLLRLRDRALNELRVQIGLPLSGRPETRGPRLGQPVHRRARGRMSCTAGHPLTEQNLYRPRGHPEHRKCRLCMAAAQRRYRERKRCPGPIL